MSKLPQLLLLAIAFGAATAGQQPPTPPRDPRAPGTAQPAAAPLGKASIVGSVTVLGSGAPARRARVSISAPELRPSLSRITDNEGKFAFTGLPAGRYSLSVSKTGYINVMYGQHRPGGGRAGTPIQLADGQTFEARVHLPRGGAITGIVIDEHGDTAQGIPVRALRWSLQSGQRTLQNAGAGNTDDRGVFRVFNLQPGDYVLCASPRGGSEADSMQAEFEARRRAAEATAARDPAEARALIDRLAVLEAQQQKEGGNIGYAPVCFPGIASPSGATPITVAAGEERAGVDFQLQLAPLATIEGVVMNPAGGSLQNVQVMLRPAGEAALSEQRSARADGNGRFRFNGVPPGQYSLTARGAVLLSGTGQNMSAEGGRGTMRVLVDGKIASEQTRLWAATDLSVDGRNISNVLLQLMAGMTISGQITFNGTEQRPADLTRLRVSANGIQSPANPETPSAQGRVDATGRFTITNVMPGRYRLSASGAGQGWFVESAVVSDQDTLDFPIEIRPHQKVTDATITFTDKQAEFSGTIVNQRNEPVTAYTAILFPADSRYWTPQSRRIMTSRPATDGRFTFRGLPAGEYRLATVFDPEPGSWYDPAFLQQLQGASTAVTIMAGEKKVQDVRVSTQ